MKLSDIKLGFADGSEEARLKVFTDMFYEDDFVYKRLNEDSIFIITGRKGVGKTLLSEYYMNRCEKEKNVLSKTIEVSNMKRTFLQEFGENQEIEQSEYIIFLEFHILKEIATLIIEKPTPSNLNFFKRIRLFKLKYDLKKFLKERYPSDNFSINKIETNESTEGTFTGGNEYSKIGFKEAQDIKKEYKWNKYYNVKENLEKRIFKCLKYIDIIISNDDIDEFNFSNISRESYSKFLICYINACKTINQRLKEISDSKCLVIIRDDILNSLNAYSGNFNKIIADNSVLINWLERKKDNPWEYKAAKMLFKKIRNSVEEMKELSDKEILETLFPEKIYEKDPICSLITYSYGRPREMIYWLNEVIKNNGDKNKFTENQFIDALPRYSRHLLGEIKNEMSFYFDSEYIEQLFELIMKTNKKTFKKQNFEFCFNNERQNFEKIVSVDNALKDLYMVGVIGCINEKGHTTWSFREDGKSKPNLEGKFALHHGLRKVLVN